VRGRGGAPVRMCVYVRVRVCGVLEKKSRIVG
jgi:hypothetical protein